MTVAEVDTDAEDPAVVAEIVETSAAVTAAADIADKETVNQEEIRDAALYLVGEPTLRDIQHILFLQGRFIDQMKLEGAS